MSTAPILRCFCIVLLLALPVACKPATGIADPVPAAPAAAHDSVLDAVRLQARDVEVAGRGRVVRLLPDDRHGSPHQRFLLRLEDGGTLLVAHNLDLAPRLDGLAEGDSVAFRGEYVWNPKGGTLHWTHDDPRGTHPDGWLRWRGRTYQ